MESSVDEKNWRKNWNGWATISGTNDIAITFGIIVMHHPRIIVFIHSKRRIIA